jgi:hypothetical protein
MENNIILSSLAMDLKRVALGLHHGSYGTADRFSQEALKRKNEIRSGSIAHYMKNILDQLDTVLTQKDTGRKAEDALMLSTRIQNYVLYKKTQHSI